MVGKFGVCMIGSLILHAHPQRQPDVDGSLYHTMLHRIGGRLRGQIDCTIRAMIGNLIKVFCPTRGVDMDCMKADPWPVFLHFTLTFAFIFVLAKHNALGFWKQLERFLVGRSTNAVH